MALAKLTLDDIADQRAYERERDGFRTGIIELKRRRRVAVGPVITLVFENRDTIRWQIQEMARAERMLTDEAIAGELATYNRLIPGAGQLSATLFIELTSKTELMEWLPRLVGVERSAQLVVGSGESTSVCPGTVDSEHAEQLTRETVTAAVHYLHFDLAPEAVAAFAAGPVTLALKHPHYHEQTGLSDATRASLLSDLQGRSDL